MIHVCYLSKTGIDDTLHDSINSGADMDLSCDMYHTDNATYLLSLVKCDVLLFDVDGLSHRDVISTIENLREKIPDTKIAVLIPQQTKLDLLQLMTTEIDSLVEKHNTLHISINRTIRDILKYHYIIPEEMTQSFISDFFDLKMRNLNVFAERLSITGLNLTHREAYVAYLMSQGFRNKAIARELQLTEGTVKVYVSRIYKKMGCHQREDAIDKMNRIHGRQNITKI